MSLFGPWVPAVWRPVPTHSSTAQTFRSVFLSGIRTGDCVVRSVHYIARFLTTVMTIPSMFRMFEQQQQALEVFLESLT